ncbi:MAG: (Fe-S)-binding protein [Chloroflexota bacterium]|nr:(Fe-S)-binding protein [Chloroflexota bacterium]
MIKANLEKYRADVFRCARCGTCRELYTDIPPKFRGVCPIREHTGGFEHYYARGRIMVARGILRGELTEYTPSLVDSVYTCLQCGACREAGFLKNPDGSWRVNSLEINKAMRADMVSEGIEIPEGAAKLAAAVEKTGNIYEAPKADRMKWLTPDIKVADKADLLYFPGCVTPYRLSGVAQATAKILNKAGAKFMLLGDKEVCCGDPLFMSGQLDLAREMVRKNLSLIKKMGAKRIVTACAGCYRTITQEWPKVTGKELPFEVIHSTQLVKGLVDSGKIRLPKAIEKTVTYHDPCELGRHCGIYDEPREIIKGIPGIELVEMLRNREAAWCCGAGGGVKASFPDMAVEVAGDRLAEAKEAGATMIVSACPTCEMNLSDAIRASGDGLATADVMELVVEAMGL